MNLMSKFCFGSTSGMTSALAASPWLPNPPPPHFNGSTMRLRNEIDVLVEGAA